MQPLKYTQIEKLVFGGRGLGHDYEDKATFIMNALPGEEVGFYITKAKRHYFEGIAEEIVKASPHRIEPLEPGHYLSCSPWQILTWEQENLWKQKIAQEAYGKLANIPAEIPLATTVEPQLGYRNKMEFSFTKNEAGAISLAFFKRGSKRKLPLCDCVLAEPIINEIAAKIISWLNAEAISEEILKSVIIRSNGQGQGIVALFIKEPFAFAQYPDLGNQCLGFQIYESNPKSPASVPTKLLYTEGQDHLIAELNGTQLKYGLLSFFQVNIPLFAEALDDIANFVDPTKPLVDYYSGVGAIGLPLAKMKSLSKVELVDNNEEAINYAKDNIALNKLPNCHAQCLPAEKITELITAEKTIIVDPPRAGMHKKVVQKLLDAKPQRIIYLSCNLTTQARDLELLQEDYELKFIKLYNFFPRTPHVEALAIMELKS